MKVWAHCVLVLVLVSGCNRPRWDKPDEAYKAFSSAVRRSDVKVAWEALSADTRKAAEARSRALAQASGGSVKDEPMLMFFASGYKPLPQGDVKVAKEEGQSAVVEVAVGDGGVSQSQRMVKEGDRWAVDLTEAFK
ncbi:MAG: hypothetical protein JNK82_08450 [Myxococcaceae bacterium]|nr:hypothetical protein [Myxococcaceae bacterium]